MAIGALAKALALHGPSHQPPPSQDNNPHYDRALTYYGHALRLVRLQQNPDSGALRIAVIACVLFACFEAMHDSRDAAVSHINHGLMIIEQFLHSHTNYLEASPTPFFLEDEILHLFQRLEYLSWSTGLIHPLPQSLRVNFAVSRSPSRYDMPSTFRDVSEARLWWDLVQHRALRPVVERSPNIPSPPGTITPLVSGIPIDPQLESTENNNLDMMKRWSVAFEPHYAEAVANKEENPTRYFQAVSLLLHYHSSWTCLRVACSANSYETRLCMTPRFREIVRLAGIVLANQPKPIGCAKVLTMEQGPTLPLFKVAMRCLDPSIRADAIELLKAYPRRDAFWDSQALARQVESDLESTTEQSRPEQLACPGPWMAG